MVTKLQIVDGARHFGATLGEIARTGHIAQRARRLGFILPPETDLAPGAPLHARLYRNQWIVDCPDCRNAEFAFIDEPRFMCSECFNGAVGYLWRVLAFPANRPQIEAILRARPIPHNRNWLPGETVAQLKRENRGHGLPAEEVE